MAPEQHTGQDADVRSDQYSFAVTLYRALYGALYGVLPFYATSSVELLAREMAMRLPDHQASFEFPRRLDAALRRALAPMPRDRFRSQQAILDELSRMPRRRAWLSEIGALAVGALLTVAAAPEVAKLASDRGAQAPAPSAAVVVEHAERLIDDADAATSEGKRTDAIAMADELIAIGTRARERDTSGYSTCSPPRTRSRRSTSPRQPATTPRRCRDDGDVADCRQQARGCHPLIAHARCAA